jgi:hypothetical protein
MTAWLASMLLTCGASAQPQDIESLIPPVDRSTSTALHEELDRTRTAFVRAQLDVRQSSRLVENNARQTDAYRAALAEVQTARQRLVSLQQPILDGLRNDPDYARMRDRQVALRDQIAAEFSAVKPRYREIAVLAREILELSPRIARIEIIALALDPDIEPARQNFMKSFAVLRQLNREASITAAEDDSVRIARSEIDQLRGRLDALSLQLAEALQIEAEAQRLRDAKIDAVRRRGIGRD